jgi:hypothetical protein
MDFRFVSLGFFILVGRHLHSCMAVQRKLDHLPECVLRFHRGAYVSGEPFRQTRQHGLEREAARDNTILRVGLVEPRALDSLEGR